MVILLQKKDRREKINTTRTRKPRNTYVRRRKSCNNLRTFYTRRRGYGVGTGRRASRGKRRTGGFFDDGVFGGGGNKRKVAASLEIGMEAIDSSEELFTKSPEEIHLNSVRDENNVTV